MNNRTKLLIAIGATVTANCQPCLEHLIGEAKDIGAEKKEILEAIAVMRKLLRKIQRRDVAEVDKD